MRDDFTTLSANWLENSALSPIVVRQGDVNKNSSWDCIEEAEQSVADVNDNGTRHRDWLADTKARGSVAERKREQDLRGKNPEQGGESQSDLEGFYRS